MRRTLLCPFTKKFKHAFELDDKDPSHRLIDTHLSKKLSEPKQLEQMLVWMVKGAVKWHQQGLPEPPARMRDAKAAFVEENDVLGQFISDRCETSAEYTVSTSQFKELFEMEAGIKISKAKLTKQMQAKGYKTQRQTTGAKLAVFVGINIIHTF